MARPVLPALLVVGGGILNLLGGLTLIGLGGESGVPGTIAGSVIVLLGLLIALWPTPRTYLAFAALVFAVLGIFWALAGFVVGLFLVLLGAVMAYVWVPPSEAYDRSGSPPAPR